MNKPATEVNLSRELDAPRDLVWEAFSNGAHVAKWIAPDQFRAECTVELHPGGRFDIRMIGMGMDHTARGLVREVVPKERIVWAFGFDDVPGHEIVTTVTFASHGAKTQLTVRQVFPKWESLSPAEQALLGPRMAGAPIGWGQSLDHLAALVKR